ncbi:MAG: hypothetical protein H0X24_04060 [Ktedonobacterales bacterium]|nr:hypothetical protein [Ktedonobacterales bacterium]
MASNKKSRVRVQQGVESLLQIVSQNAMDKFDTCSPVRRVVMKINPSVYGEFLVMAILRNGQRFEAQVQGTTHAIVWCEIPNCNCVGFARTASPLEAGMTIED